MKRTCNVEIEKEIDKEIELERESSARARVRAGDEQPENGDFVPPTLEEVTAYCKERKSSVDPKRFYDFFNAGHWIDSRGSPVKNWKQKLISWERDEKDKGKKSEKSRSFEPTKFD